MPFTFLKTLLTSFLALSAIAGLNGQSIVSIAEIQGTGTVSPYLGDLVRVDHAVVTLIEGGSMVIQTPAGMDDENDQTSEAILVEGFIPSWVSVGSNVRVEGEVSEFDGGTLIEDPGLSITELTEGLSPQLDNLNIRAETINFSDIENLEPLEWMSFLFQDATLSSATDGGTDWFYVHFGGERPAREPGIYAPGINGLPKFDRNLENFVFFPEEVGLPALPAGSRITGRCIIYPDLDRYFALGYDYQTDAAQVHQPVQSPDEDYLSIASANLLFLNRNYSDFNLRLPKIADYLVNGLDQPDVIAVQEVADQSTLNFVADRMNSLLGGNFYSAYLLPGNNGSSINSGFLVKDRIQVLDVQSLGKNQDISLGGALHDRPPILLLAQTSTDPAITFQVLNLHLRSLNGIEGGSSFYVRTKRHEQAVSVANMVQSLRGENLFIVGDYNAFPFSDGYVDIYNQIQGGESEGSSFEVEPIVAPALQEPVQSENERESYSYVFDGNTQRLDHILFNDLAEMTFEEIQFFRGNSDAPYTWENSYSRPERASDHDGLVSYYSLPHAWGTIIVEPPIGRPFVEFTNPYVLGVPLRFYPKQGDIYEVDLFDLAGRKVKTWKTDFIGDNDIWELPLNSHPGQGFYILEIRGEDFKWSEPILFGIE
ncbi:MAG: hypothetical protein HKN16_05810 [Saprospiraceae bacterium]|nr:hypothetical protein [Saprospiraceae bacterium]